MCLYAVHVSVGHIDHMHVSTIAQRLQQAGPYFVAAAPCLCPVVLQYWTYKNLSEQLMLPVTDSGINVMTNGTRTLWAMGNNYVTAAREVIFFANQWKAR